MNVHALRNGFVAASLMLAVAACGGPDGEPVPAPSPSPSPSPSPDPGSELEISITPTRGPVGTSVSIRTEGFSPGAQVELGFGPVQSEFDVFDRATADANGVVATPAPIPDWAEAGRDYVFAAVAPDREKVISSRFHVTSGEDDDAETVTVTGTLTGEGVECPALRTDQDELYTLAGDLGGFDEGDRVTVEGTIAEMSFCMQGTTLEVRRISRAG